MITIYGNVGCSYCERAVKLCEDYEFKYTYKSIQDPDVFMELQELVPGVRTVPQIFWHSKYVGGYSHLVEEVENTQQFGQEKI